MVGSSCCYFSSLLFFLHHPPPLSAWAALSYSGTGIAFDMTSRFDMTGMSFLDLVPAPSTTSSVPLYGCKYSLLGSRSAPAGFTSLLLCLFMSLFSLTTMPFAHTFVAGFMERTVYTTGKSGQHAVARQHLLPSMGGGRSFSCSIIVFCIASVWRAFAARVRHAVTTPLYCIAVHVFIHFIAFTTFIPFILLFHFYSI